MAETARGEHSRPRVIISALARWPVGSVVRVAFLDGDTALHADIVSATAEIAEIVNLTLDFGLDPATGSYRRWKESDTVLQAEIRVSFDMPGYWSFVGTDSTDATIAPAGPIGGGPGSEASTSAGTRRANRRTGRAPCGTSSSMRWRSSTSTRTCAGRAPTTSAGTTTTGTCRRRTRVGSSFPPNSACGFSAAIPNGPCCSSIRPSAFPSRKLGEKQSVGPYGKTE